jgi:hypothetical protein
MRIPAALAVGSLALALAGPARAAPSAPPPDHGPEVALRTGVAIPAGSVRDGTSLDSYASSAVPLVLEGGYRVEPDLFVGARFQYAFAQLKDPNATQTCGGNTSCSGSDVQLGVEGIYRFLADQRFAPWLGLGFGYEWASADYDSQNIGEGGTNKGFFGLAQAGGDARVNGALVLGPFLDVAFGRFDSAETHAHFGNMSGSMTSDITNTAVHTWITVGVRGAFGF